MNVERTPLDATDDDVMGAIGKLAYRCDRSLEVDLQITS